MNELGTKKIIVADHTLQEAKRFENTESGISPRAIPGTEGYIFTASGLEHTERGIPDYTPETHTIMSAKRHRKIQAALRDLPVPVDISPEGDLNLGVIAWGSTFGAALEAVRLFKDLGFKIMTTEGTHYFLDERGIEIRRGVWWRHVVHVPRSRVQHTDVNQGPIERTYGLAHLIIHTAGTISASVALEGLERAVAHLMSRN